MSAQPSFGPRPVEVLPVAAPDPAPAIEISVVVPVLDEAESVGELAARVAAVLDGLARSFEIVFVDDGSRDGTPDRVRSARERDPRVKLVLLRRNFGKAAALTAGFEHSRGAIVITMDGDLQDSPEEIPRLLAELSVYGELHRYIPVLASRRGFTVGEIEVDHQPRRHGVSKYGWDRLYKGLLDLITVLFITKYTRRPLHLFGAVGLVFLALGFGINCYLAILWFLGQTLSNRPLLLLGMLLMLMGIQVLTTGLLGEMLTFKSFRRPDSYSIKEWLE